MPQFLNKHGFYEGFETEEERLKRYSDEADELDNNANLSDPYIYVPQVEEMYWNNDWNQPY